MSANLRSHLTFANVVACIALFVALGGTSVAAVSLRKNSVGSNQIKRGAVKGSELARGAVSSAKVKDRSLLSKDFKPGQLPKGSPGASGQNGASGPSGATGPQGAAAASFLAGRFSVTSLGTEFFGAPAGISTAGAETTVQMLSPARPVVAHDLAISESIAISGDGSRTYDLRVNGADTALSCIIISDATTCSDTSHLVTIAPGSLLAVHDLKGAAGSRTGADIRFGWRATTP